MVCARCHLRWDTNDPDPPPCKPDLNEIKKTKTITKQDWERVKTWAQNGFKDEERPDKRG